MNEFISEPELDQLVKFFKLKQEEDALEKAGIGALQDYKIIRSVRGDEIYWLDYDRDIALHNFFTLFEEMKHFLNRHCFLSLSGYEFHLAHYPPGAHYERHVDQFQKRNNRMISMVLYLNTNWKKSDGGELKLYLNQEETLIEPIAGRCILFKSDVIEHEVLTTNFNRLSLTGWFLYQPAPLGFLLG